MNDDIIKRATLCSLPKFAASLEEEEDDYAAGLPSQLGNIVSSAMNPGSATTLAEKTKARCLSMTLSLILIGLFFFLSLSKPLVSLVLFH